MDPWTAFVGVIYSTLLALSQLYGGSMGAAILTLTVVVRLALLPVTVRAARRSLWRQRVLVQLQPEVDRLKRRFEKKPARLAEALRSLHERHDVKPIDGRSLGGLLLQAPLFLGLYSAIGRGLVRGGRFLWIRDIAQPDLPLAIAAAALSGIVVTLSPATSEQSAAAALVPTILTFVLLLRLAAGLGLYVAASNAVSILQSWIVRRLGPSPA